MRKFLAATAVAALVVTLIQITPPTAAHAATAVPGDPLTGSGVVSRSLLTTAQLTSGSSTGTIAYSAFALPATAAPPAHQFEGTLTLNGVATAGGFTSLKDPHGYSTLETLKHLPPFSIQLVQNGSHLIPTVRGLQYTGSAHWNLAVGPGRAWSETTDGGQTRASLPFALIERNANCTHNGVLSFVFTNTSISNVRYQVASETCEYFQYNMWGQVGATYAKTTVSGAEAARNAYAAEVAARFPTKPMAQLSTDHPGVSVSAFSSGTTSSAISTFGFVHDGTHYVGGCPTRQGEYPFCGQLLLPSYSTAKSAFGGVALMRLAQKYGTGVVSTLLRTHVPQATGSQWNGVTIEHALDMATGNYTDPGFEVDEAGSVMLDFFLTENPTEKLTKALSFTRKVTPGTTWNYHTSDTYLAVRAMDGYLKAQEGSSAEIFAMLRDEVLAPAGVGPDSLTTVRTGNSNSGAAFGGYGMFWTRDDIAKVATLLNVDDGAVGGQQVLHTGILDAALQRDSANRGLITPGATPYRYNNSFWARDFSSANNPAFTEPFSVPFMSGFGGITVALMPNDTTYYMFSDNNEFNWTDVVAESHKIASMIDGGEDPGDPGDPGDPPPPTCTGDVIVNGGFETGSATPWVATATTVDNRTWLQPARTGSWKAWLNGWGSTSTETLAQTVTIPAGCTDAALKFYLRITSAETLANPYDNLYLTVQPAGGSSTTLASWSNLDKQGYTLEAVDLGAYAGTTVTLKFWGYEDYSLQTSFVIDDVSLPLAG